MQPSSGDFFKEPAIKLLCSQLKNYIPKRVQGSCDQYLIPLKSSNSGKEIKYPVQSVWLQGTIFKVICNSEVLLEDVSGEMIKIVGCDKFAGGVSHYWIKQGSIL